MDSKQFKEFAKAAVDYIADYIDTIEQRPVAANVPPNYLKDLIPDEAPESGEPWQDILQDVDRIIMPGITHWASPNFHAFFPTGFSFPSIVGEMVSAGFGCIGLSWVASPAYTELEAAMMDWLAKLIGLPEEFLNSSEGPGGGVIQGSASEVTFVALLTAKERKVREIKSIHPEMSEAEIKGKLVAYSSNQSNSSVEKSGLLASVTMRLIPADKDGQLRGKEFLKAIQQDKEQGLIPCYLVGTLGTTPTCAFDKLEELGPICKKENIWLHVDAAYAGSAFACPEYRHLMRGIEFADSFNFNPHKWMLVNFDCSAMWIRDAKHLVEAFNVDRIYLKDQHQGLAPEYRHWQIALGRRFRALKLWFVLRSYGVQGIQNHIRKQIALSKHFEELVQSDARFEVCTQNMGLVCFKLKGGDSTTMKLLEEIQRKGEIFVHAGHFRESHVIRFSICSPFSEKRHIDYAWSKIKNVADEILGTKLFEIKEKGIASIEFTNPRRKVINGDEKSK